MKKLLIAATLSLPLLASAQNLLTNGSFENGLTGWTVTQSAGTIYPVSTVTYGELPGAFGEIVPADNNPRNLSPDPAGNSAAYFVDDNTVQRISQSFTVPTTGLYNIGFSVYLPVNGYANPGDLSIGQPAVVLTSLFPSVWQGNNVVINLNAGVSQFSLTFTTRGGPSKDFLLDRVYVTAVPEPSTYALLAAGLGAVSLVAARRRRG